MTTTGGWSFVVDQSKYWRLVIERVQNAVWSLCLQCFGVYSELLYTRDTFLQIITFIMWLFCFYFPKHRKLISPYLCLLNSISPRIVSLILCSNLLQTFKAFSQYSLCMVDVKITNCINASWKKQTENLFSFTKMFHVDSMKQ